MLVRDSVAEFLESVKARLAPKTYTTYRQRLSGFVLKFGDIELEAIDRRQVLDWLEREVLGRDSPLAPDTQRSTLVALRQWEKHAHARDGLKQRLIPKQMKKPSGRKRERIPTRKEINSVLKLASRPFARIYRALRYTGARPSELAGAQIGDWDREAHLIVLKEHKTKKTGQTRRIGIGRKMARVLGHAIGTRTEGPIFLNDRGRKWTSETLSHTYRRLRDRAGLSEELVLYSTRHFAGTTICKALGIHAAAHALGHRTIQTTQRYCHPSDEDLGGYQDRVF